MDQLTIVGTEDGALILATENGDRFALRIDDVLRTAVRRSGSSAAAPDGPRVSPREIQTQIRAGLSASEVAELLGVPIADVERYEAPVIAEREYVVSQALAVPVLMGTELEPDGSLSFGEAIRGKLADLSATGEHWVSWKDENGWFVKLEFTANDIEHDARWSFDPKRSTLSPQNDDATQLSRQGSLPEGLIPRLRAVEPAPSPFKDTSRFDSGAFGPRRLPDPPAADEGEPLSDPVHNAAIKRAPEPAETTNPDTADLLEALRRRRGQREPLPGLAEVSGPVESSAPVPLFDTPSAADEDPSPAVADSPAESAPPRKRGRPGLPSWDDIVFGTRGDDA